MPKPAGYSTTSLQTADVDGIAWFQQIGARLVHWTAVRHGANIELDVPTSYPDQGALLVDIGAAIRLAQI